MTQDQAKTISAMDLLAVVTMAEASAKGIFAAQINEFHNSGDLFVDVNTIVKFADRNHNELKQAFLRNLPPKNEKAPTKWANVTVCVVPVENSKGDVEKHCWLIRSDLVAAQAAEEAASAAAAELEFEQNPDTTSKK